MYQALKQQICSETIKHSLTGDFLPMSGVDIHHFAGSHLLLVCEPPLAHALQVLAHAAFVCGARDDHHTSLSVPLEKDLHVNVSEMQALVSSQ